MFKWDRILHLVTIANFSRNRKATLVYPKTGFHRFNFGNDSLVVVGEESTDQVEHGIASSKFLAS